MPSCVLPRANAHAIAHAIADIHRAAQFVTIPWVGIFPDMTTILDVIRTGRSSIATMVSMMPIGLDARCTPRA